MNIYIDKTDTNKTLTFNGKAETLLNKLDINPEEVIVVKNDNVVSLDHTLKNDDDIEILTVISGG